MFLAVAATEMEMCPFLEGTKDADGRWRTLLCGVGPVEAAVRLGRFLAENREVVDGLLLFGVGGGYVLPKTDPIPLLSVCLAEREVLGDLGICHDGWIEPLPSSLTGETAFVLDAPLLAEAERVLMAKNIGYRRGTFVTVCASSGTGVRGQHLQQQWQGLCENMEGAAVARLCREFGIPMLEVRAVSNLVEDRDMNRWKLQDACVRAGEVAALLIKELA